MVTDEQRGPAGTGTPSLLGLVLILTVVIAVAILLGFGR